MLLVDSHRRGCSMLVAPTELLEAAQGAGVPKEHKPLGSGWQAGQQVVFDDVARCTHDYRLNVERTEQVPALSISLNVTDGAPLHDPAHIC